MIYFNGQYKEQGPLIESDDRGFLLGDGLFETILVRHGCPVFLEDHLARLDKGCQALKLKNTLDVDQVRTIITTLADACQLGEGDSSARITVSRGLSHRGLLFPDVDSSTPTVMITITRAPSIKEYFQYHISPYKRASSSVTSSHKTMNYLDNIMARNNAHDAELDEAVMCNEFGMVACGSISNIFAITKTGEIVTPREEDGALGGIVRKKIIGMATSLGSPVQEQQIEPAMLGQAFVFFTNSLMGLMPTNDKPPEIFVKLYEAYNACIEDDLKRFPEFSIDAEK